MSSCVELSYVGRKVRAHHSYQISKGVFPRFLLNSNRSDAKIRQWLGSIDVSTCFSFNDTFHWHTFLILCNLRFHYCFHKRSPLVPILNHINPVHIITISLTSTLILSTYLRHLPSVLFLSGSPTSILYALLLSHSCYIPRTYAPWLDHSTCTWQRVQVMKLLIIQIFPTSCHFISLRSVYSPQHPVLKHPQSMFMSETKFHTHTEPLYTTLRPVYSVVHFNPMLMKGPSIGVKTITAWAWQVRRKKQH
jgi:hypothetical protein